MAKCIYLGYVSMYDAYFASDYEIDVLHFVMYTEHFTITHCLSISKFIRFICNSKLTSKVLQKSLKVQKG
jgi:hypothetical protein